MQANIGGSSMVLFLPTTIPSLTRWNQIDNAFDILYYYFLSKAKAYSLLAFCTAIAGVVLFVCRRKSSNIIFGQTGLLLVMLFK